MIDRAEEIVIHQVLNRFEKGDMKILNVIADDIDFEISHYRDDADISWQKAKSKTEFGEVLSRLATEVFSKGTKIEDLYSIGLGGGWFLTSLKQQFFYELTKNTVASSTFILSHEKDGKLDYFRETVKDVTPFLNN